MMRRFVLDRLEDETGVTGTGTVAEGVEFTDGTVALRWLPAAGTHMSTVVWDSLESMQTVHGHKGKTVVQFYLGDE